MLADSPEAHSVLDTFGVSKSSRPLVDGMISILPHVANEPRFKGTWEDFASTVEKKLVKAYRAGPE